MNVIVLGATGSIGTQTLALLKAHQDKLVAFSFGSSIDAAKKIIDEFQPSLVCAQTKNDADGLHQEYPSIRFVHGPNGLLELAGLTGDYTLVNALVGSVGLAPTVRAIETKKRICIANKETLVIAGELIMKLVQQYKVTLLPVDSEHVAIHQAMQGDVNVESVVLTASGGSLRDWAKEDLPKATIHDVLQHPNWSMGDKITVDSATMMNKGFEIIEAHHLFGIDYNHIQTVLHPESLVHGLVTYADGSVLAQLAHPTMSIPIAYALYYPKKIQLAAFDWQRLSSLRFGVINEARYPLIRLAIDVGQQGGVLPCVMNAANEAAVRLFLEGHILFTQIESIVESTVTEYENQPLISITQAIQIDQEVYNKVLNHYVNERSTA